MYRHTHATEDSYSSWFPPFTMWVLGIELTQFLQVWWQVPLSAELTSPALAFSPYLPLTDFFLVICLCDHKTNILDPNPI